jgi:hypothetical protein
VRDGVGCESCHGPAEKWLAPHVGWKDLTPAERKHAYAEHGMTWLRDPASRAKACATCHVGTGEADVNHDLIAAGHPRLNFEVSAYQQRMPRHWDETAERARLPGYNARTWALGQAAAARAALELLASRAQPKQRPWPEFAEYRCTACHHDLRNDGLPAAKEAAGPLPGLLPWSDWYYAMLPYALAFHPTEDTKAILTSLTELQKLMRQPLPDAIKVAGKARATADLLTRWLAAADQGRFTDLTLLRQTRAALMREEPPLAGGDSTVQRYLALSAIYRTERALRPDESDGDFETYLQGLRKDLRVGSSKE